MCHSISLKYLLLINALVFLSCGRQTIANTSDEESFLLRWGRKLNAKVYLEKDVKSVNLNKSNGELAIAVISNDADLCNKTHIELEFIADSIMFDAANVFNHLYNHKSVIIIFSKYSFTGGIQQTDCSREFMYNLDSLKFISVTCKANMQSFKN